MYVSRQSIWSTSRCPAKFQISISLNFNMVFKVPEYGDFGFFTEFRITVLVRILCKFFKNLHIIISYSCHLWHQIKMFLTQNKPAEKVPMSLNARKNVGK